jgi:hypothetical protein
MASGAEGAEGVIAQHFLKIQVCTTPQQIFAQHKVHS